MPAWIWLVLACGTPAPVAPCGDLGGAACFDAAVAQEAAGDEGPALDRFEDACFRLDQASACSAYGRALRGGAAAALAPDADLSGAASPFGRALVALGRACDLGVAEDCRELGLLAFQGKGVPRDLSVARQRLDRACELGDLETCVDAALVQERQDGDVTAALPRFADACERGAGRACTKLGLSLARQGAAPASVLEAYDKGCAAGFAAGCGLGAVLLTGQGGVEADPVARQRLLVAGARLSDPSAADHLGTLLAGSKADAQAALRATLADVAAGLAPGCEGGDAAACHTLGVLHLALGTPSAQIGAWFKTACQGGERGACGRLAGLARSGAIPADGLGKLVDLEGAGCAGGHAPSCFALGAALEAGSETEKVDLAAALEAYGRACAGEFAEGCVAAERLSGRRVPTP